MSESPFTNIAFTKSDSDVVKETDIALKSVVVLSNALEKFAMADLSASSSLSSEAAYLAAIPSPGCQTWPPCLRGAEVSSTSSRRNQTWTDI